MRRVLGASSQNLIVVFSKPFARLMAVGFFIAVPIVYKLSETWLSSFAYRTPLKVSDLMMVSSIAVVLVALVLLRQLLQVVRLNPVDNLRSE